MNKFKLLFAPIACFVMSLIVTIAWSAGLQWSESSNFAIALIFWILCIICIVVSIFLLPIVNIDFPFKVAIVLLDILYYITFVVIVSCGVFTISGVIFLVTQLSMIFIYLVIVTPIIVMGFRQAEGE